jgi:hypothetical protein
MQSSEMPGQLAVDVIARVLDITPRRVQQLAEEGWIPKANHGQYLLVPSVRGYLRYLKSGRTLKEEQFRLTQLKREALEVRLAKLHRKVISVAVVRRALANLERRIRNGVSTEEDLRSIVARAEQEMGLGPEQEVAS